MTPRERLLRALKERKVGYTEELKAQLIGPDFSPNLFDDIYKELGLVGVIRQGYDGLGHLRFKLRNFGEDYCDSFLLFGDAKNRLINLKNKLGVLQSR